MRRRGADARRVASRHQPSKRPIGRLPTSPRKIVATGRLNGAKPIIAPQSAAATIAAVSGSSPNRPSSASAAVTGTTSATVIQSRPSMKLTRLTNQSPASTRRPRSTQNGTDGAMRRSLGLVSTIAPTASACSKSRGSTGTGLMSSAKPSAAMNRAAPKSPAGKIEPASGMQSEGQARDHQRRRDHGNACALRRRSLMRRSRIRLCQRVLQKLRTDQPDHNGRDDRGGQCHG